ncbi:P-loop containing nucleoside triphosphate hydrolase protein [Aspergillus cavernicola]|uniref:P-loop containing nucleoside triphosphate hydrolase protein n=1 Tax=Aspergillus cavernicola TaxID=176166 RepID=A0ABR4HM69_9EURO
MVIRRLSTSALEALCSKDQMQLLDSIDHLRLQGINHYISLPQIIVCGDQSSGKSSVLEAISGVSFPIRNSLCTRFPTELVLRKNVYTNVTVSIVPHQSRSDQDRERLLQFHEVLDSFEGLPDLVERAKTAMGIYAHVPGKAFSDDTLRIEVSGPDRPHLTIVDLPGLIHSETKHQSAADVDLVRDIVKTYMEEPRSIILAVVSAKNDVPNQIVLKLAREADPSGARTLGVITKPDTLVPGSDSEAHFISLAKNQEVEFRLGWHVLKNMDTDKGSSTLPARNQEESAFFSRGVWESLPRCHVGIDDLRERLSKLLLNQIATELPSLIAEIKAKVDDCHDSLNKLGTPRATLDDQRSYLFHISQSFQNLIKAGVDGTYNHPFFGNAQSESGYKKRIRAVVQNLNSNFTKHMYLHGHLRRIEGHEEEYEEEEDISEDQEIITRGGYIRHIEKLLHRIRGRELPGTFNPMIVNDLFVEQSQLWKPIATNHVRRTWNEVKFFIQAAVIEVTDVTTSSGLMKQVFDPRLDNILRRLEEGTMHLINLDQQGHPITYNHYFTDNLQTARQEELKPKFTQAIGKFFETPLLTRSYVPETPIDLVRLRDALLESAEADMTRFAAAEALNCMTAYYKVALKRFVDGIAIGIIETTLVQALIDIFSPTVVDNMSPGLVTLIAGESRETRDLREQLSKKLEILGSGLGICQKFSQASDFGTLSTELTPAESSRLDMDCPALSDDEASMNSIAVTWTRAGLKTNC